MQEPPPLPTQEISIDRRGGSPHERPRPGSIMRDIGRRVVQLHKITQYDQYMRCARPGNATKTRVRRQRVKHKIWAIYCAKNIVGGLARRFTTLPENPRRSSKIHSGSLTVYKNTRKLVRQDAARARSCGVRKFNILTWVLAISQVDTQSSRLIDDHRWCGLSYFLSTLKVSCNNVTSSFSVSILNLECSCTRSTGPSTSCLPVIGLSSC